MTRGARDDLPQATTPVAEGADAALVTVRLLDLPVRVFAETQQHSDELIRELTHIAHQIAASGEAGGTDVAAVPHTSRELPARLVALVEELNAGYSAFTAQQEQQLDDAVAAGELSISELVYLVPPAAAGAARHLGAMLDEADDFCRAGRHLLTLAPQPDLVAFRRWYLSEFENQIAGRAPTPWPQYAASVVR